MREANPFISTASELNKAIKAIHAQPILHNILTKDLLSSML